MLPGSERRYAVGYRQELFTTIDEIKSLNQLETDEIMPQDTLILVKSRRLRYRLTKVRSIAYTVYKIQREKHKILGETMRLRALAKINLGLDVVRKREDGYHEVRMIMRDN